MIKILFDKMIKFAVEIQYIHLHSGTGWAITWGMRCYFMFSLFRVKTSSKEETMITLTCAPRCILKWRAYTAICRATSKSIKTPFTVWIYWKKWT